MMSKLVLNDCFMMYETCRFKSIHMIIIYSILAIHLHKILILYKHYVANLTFSTRPVLYLFYFNEELLIYQRASMITFYHKIIIKYLKFLNI